MVDASMNFLSEKEVFFSSNLFQKYLVLAMRSMGCWEAKNLTTAQLSVQTNKRNGDMIFI